MLERQTKQKLGEEIGETIGVLSLVSLGFLTHYIDRKYCYGLGYCIPTTGEDPFDKVILFVMFVAAIKGGRKIGKRIDEACHLSEKLEKMGLFSTTVASSSNAIDYNDAYGVPQNKRSSFGSGF